MSDFKININPNSPDSVMQSSTKSEQKQNTPLPLVRPSSKDNAEELPTGFAIDKRDSVPLDEQVAASEVSCKPMSVSQKPKDGKFSYTVQASEDYIDLIKRVLKEQGNTNPSAKDIDEMDKQFRTDNPNAVKMSKKGIPYLLVGTSVQIRADLGDRKNTKEQEDLYLYTINGHTAIYEYKNTYDSKGLLVHQECENKNPSGVSVGTKLNISKTYDADGRIATETNSYGDVTTNQYDVSGNLIKQTTLVKSSGKTVTKTREYDTNGHLTKLTKTPPGLVTEYTYDASGKRVGIKGVSWNRTYKYNSDGKVSEYTDSDSSGKTTYIITYSPNGLVESIERKDEPINPDRQIKYQYHYNSNGQVRQVVTYNKDNIMGRIGLEYDKNGVASDANVQGGGYNYYQGLNPNSINDFSLADDDVLIFT